VADAVLLGGGSSHKVSQAGGPFSTTGNFTVSVTGLPSADQIFFVVYAINGLGTTTSNGENFYTHAATPGQASGITLQSRTDTDITIQFAAANTVSPAPSSEGGYLVYRSSVSTPAPTLTNGTAYSTGGSFRTATNTSATTFSSSGLNPESPYFFAIIPYDWDDPENSTYAYNATGFPTATFYTFATQVDNQPDDVLSASASSPTNIDLTFPALTGNGISDEGYIILRGVGSAPDLTTLVDGQAPTASVHYRQTITNTSTTTFSDGTVVPGQTYHYALIPYTWDGSHFETINYRITAGTFPVRITSASTPLSTVNVSGFVTPGSNGLSTNFIGSENDQVIIGFSINSSNGPSTLNTVKINLNNDPTGVLTNFELFENTSSTFSATGSKGTATPTAGVLSWTVNNALATNVVEYYYLVADIPAGASPSTTFNFSVANADLIITGGTPGGGPFNRTITVDKLTTSFVAGSGATTTAIGSAANQKILSVTASSNLSQTVQKLVFDFDVDVDPILNTSSLALKISGTPVSGAGYAYDGTAKTLTVTNINTPISTAVTFDLHADVLATAGSNFTASLKVANNPADNSATTVNQGFVNNFANITNTVTVTPLEANFIVNAGAITNGITGTANQKILSLTASSVGTQTLQKLIFNFDVDVATTLNTSTLALKVAGTPVSGASYNYDGTAKTLTVSGINTSITSPVVFDLHADVLISASAGFTVSLTSANNPTNNSLTTVNQGLVKNFTTISNTVSITPLQANFVSNTGTVATVIGAQTDQKILALTASSNGNQTLQKLIFHFSTDVSTTLNTSSFLLKIGGVTVGTATYGYSSGTQNLTVSNINTSISSAVNFDLHADVLASATTGFTASVSTTDNPADNSATTVNQGILTAFATISNAVGVTPLAANFVTNAGAVSTVIGAQTNQKILALTASSNGTQTLQKLVFKFSTDITTTINTSSIRLKIANVNVVGANYAYSAGTQQLTVSNINTAISSPVDFDLHGNVLASATTGFTVSLSTTENPTNNSIATVDQGFLTSFTTISNAVSVTPLATAFTTNVGSVATAVAGNANQKILALTALSNGAQTLQKLVFHFDVDVATTINTASFSLKIAGTPVATAAYLYDGSAKTLTVSTINTTVSVSRNFDLHADILPSATGDFTVGFSTTNNPTDNSITNVNQGYLTNFTTITNAVGIDPLEASFAPVAGASTTAVGGNTAVKLLSFSAATTIGGAQTLEKLIFSFSADVASSYTGFVLKNGASTVGTASYNSGTQLLTVSGIAQNISTSQTLDIYADVLSNATNGTFTLTLSNANNPTNNSASTVNHGYVATFADINNVVTISALTATISPVSGGGVLTSAGALEAGTTNRPLFGFSISSNGTQAFSSLTLNLTNEPNGLTNFRLFKGTVGSVGTSIATAADPGVGVNTITFSPGVSIVTGTTDYFYLVANVKGLATTAFNAVQVTVDPMTTAVTLGTGIKTVGVNPVPFTGDNYTFVSSVSTVLANNNGETSPINFGIYNTKIAASGLTTANAQKLYSFTISGADNDSHPTNLTQVQFNVTKIQNLASLALITNAGSVKISEVDVSAMSGTSAVSFGTGSSTILSVADNATVTIDVYGTFRTGAALSDNDIIQFTYNGAFTDNIASGVSTPAAAFNSDGGKNNITVVATELVIRTLNATTQLPIAKANPNSNFLIRATAEDLNGNVDVNKVNSASLDFSAPNPLTKTITPGVSQAWVAGRVTWTAAIAPADVYDLTVTDLEPPPPPPTNHGLGSKTIQFQIESLGTTKIEATFQSCQVGAADIYATLPNLTLTETDPGDFQPGTDVTFLLILPTGWQFQPTSTPGFIAPTFNFAASGNFTAATFSNLIGSSIAKFTYSVTGSNLPDQMVISGLKVKNVNAVALDSIMRSGTGVIIGADETRSLGDLSLPAGQPTLQIAVEAQPGQTALPSNQRVFGVDDPAFILNALVGGNTAAVADVSIIGSGVGKRAVPPGAINSDRYLFTPTAVNAGILPITVTYVNPTTKCRLTLVDNITVRNVAITGLETGPFCLNDNTVQSLGVASGDIPGGKRIYDFTYRDPSFAVNRTITNDPDLTNTNLVLHTGTVASPVATPFTTPTTKTMSAVTLNPKLKFEGLYDYGCVGGCGYQTASVTNPAMGRDIYTTTSFIRLTISNHGYTVGSRIFINGILDYFYPQPISFREFTVVEVEDVNNIIINVGEGAFDYRFNDICPYTRDYGWMEFWVYNPPTYNIPVYLVDQSFNTVIDFRVPAHGFTTGDRIMVRGFRNFSPSFDGQLFTVTKLNADFIRINVQEYFGSSVTSINASWFGETFVITPDINIPLPGFVFDATAPYPHKGAVRSTFDNDEFVPSVWSTNWGSQELAISARVIPTGCATAGPDCQVTVEHNVTIDLTAPPAVDFTGLDPEYCAEAGIIELTAANDLLGLFSGLGVTDNTNTKGTFDPLHVNVIPDVPFNIQLAYTGPSGCSNTVIKSVIVHSLPVINITNPLVEICKGESVELGDTPLATANNPSYSWNNAATLDDPTLENPSADPTITTVYTVVVTDRYNCQATDQVTVVPFDPVITNANGPTAICGLSGAEITLGTSTINGALSTGTWSTSAAGQFLDVGNNPTTDFDDVVKFVPTDSVGIITLKLTSDTPSGPCPLDDDELIVNINQRAVFKAGADFEVCASDQVTVQNAKIYGSATQVTWDVFSGTGTIPTAAVLTPEYLASPNEKIFGSTVILRGITNVPNSVCPAATDNVTVFISKRALISAGTDLIRCQDQTITLNASIPANSSAGQIIGVSPYHWSIGGSSSLKFSDSNIANPTYTPDVSEYGSTVTLRVTSDDPTGACLPEFDEVQVEINAKPDALATTTYPSVCIGTPINAFTASGQNLKWYENEDLTNFRFSGASFATGELSTADKVINFYVTTTSSKNCESLPALHSLTVYPNPVARFDFSEQCLNDLTDLKAETSSVTYTFPGLSGAISKWDWNFDHDGNKEEISGASGNTTHDFPSVKTYNVALTVTTVNNCSNTITQQLRIGAIPAPSFTYQYICEGDETEFASTPGAQVIGQVASYAWDFGDNQTSNQQNPKHTFGDASLIDAYAVSITVTSDLGCVGVAERKVPILPVLQGTDFPHTESFENGSNGWATIGFPQDDRYSWKLPLSMGGNSTISTASQGNRAWIISNAAGAGPEARAIYSNDERSSLNIPCINVTDLERPVFSFEYWLDMHSADGVYMESSIDGGVTWQKLGNRGEGLGWYNNEDILGLSYKDNVGQPFVQMGWSGEVEGWQTGKFSLDQFRNQDRLRLRFVFGSNSDNPVRDLDGFGLDNFILGTRNRIVLIENFTNSAAVNNNTEFKDFASSLTNSEIVKIQYHTGIGGVDAINQDNSADPNARAAFYGLTNATNVIPRVFMDGASEGAFDPSSAWADTKLSTRALALAPFEIIINKVTNPSGALEFGTTIRAENDITEGRLALFVAAIEKNVGQNGFVVRKFLPDAGGRPIPLPLQKDQLVEMANQKWLVDIDGVNLNNLAVVAFIQDLDTKEVLQAAIDMDPNAPTAFTGVEESFERMSSVFPNPADHEVTIRLSENVLERTPLRIYDQLGKVVNEAWFEKGENTKTIDTSIHAGGVYLIQVETSKGILTRKVMILHGR
jgi:hypothetical protein